MQVIMDRPKSIVVETATFHDDADLDYQAQKMAKEREALEAKERLILAELKKKYEH